MLSLNLQPVEKPVYSDGKVLDVQEIFPTIQGEGPFAGMPSVFVRLAGCDLQCPVCDSDYTSKRKLMTIDSIAMEVDRLMPPNSRLVVLTGGEPFRQNIGLLVDLLQYDKGYKVQVETNGTLYLEEFPYAFTTIVCSPKTGSINEKLKRHITALKYVLTHDKIDPADGLPTNSLGTGVRVQRPWTDFRGEIFVQPLDEQDPEKNKLHTQAAVESCMKFGYRLCLQTHKFVNLL